MRARKPGERAVRSLRVEAGLPLPGEARALIARQRDGREPLDGNRVGERRVEAEGVGVEGIQQRRDVLEGVPAVPQCEHRRRIDHVRVVEHRNMDRPVVLSALRERRVWEKADRRFFGVLVEIHAAQLRQFSAPCRVSSIYSVRASHPNPETIQPCRLDRNLRFES
jgi:hypothetical protein